MNTNMSESACGQLSMFNHKLSGFDSSVTSTKLSPVLIKLWYMHIYISVTVLKGHEPLPGMVYNIYAEWDTLLSLLLCTFASTWSQRGSTIYSSTCMYLLSYGGANLSV